MRTIRTAIPCAMRQTCASLNLCIPLTMPATTAWSSVTTSKAMRSKPLLPLTAAALAALFPLSTHAYEVSDTFTIEAAVRGIGQYADYSGAGDEDGGNLDSKAKAAGIFDIAVDFTPTPNDELYAWLRFTAGNGLNDVGGTLLAPYGGDLEDDLKDINGRNRDYLLEAWYKHTFEFSGDSSLGITGGIIDSTGYIDNNEFANDAAVKNRGAERLRPCRLNDIQPARNAL